ncbi:3-hydroxyacyl-[acyl-carrier-protein] dehydratase FabZ [Bienertia sinuspersici]
MTESKPMPSSTYTSEDNAAGDKEITDDSLLKSTIDLDSIDKKKVSKVVEDQKEVKIADEQLHLPEKEVHEVHGVKSFKNVKGADTQISCSDSDDDPFSKPPKRKMRFTPKLEKFQPKAKKLSKQRESGKFENNSVDN